MSVESTTLKQTLTNPPLYGDQERSVTSNSASSILNIHVSNFHVRVNCTPEMKQRFSSLDVKVIAHELSNSLVTLRLANIYDLSSKIFLLKFAKPDNKKQMIIDSGFRCHLTSFSRATAAAPSDFVTRLRKYLKTRRVTCVSQVGTDRIIEFAFSDGQYRLFLEFYAAGNIILTDKELNILALLRIVAAGEGQEEQRAGLKYSLDNRQNYGGVPPLTKQRLHDALKRALDREDDALIAVKKQKKKGADALRKALAVSITEYPPMLVDHAMRVTDFDATLKPGDVLQSDALLNHLLRSLQEAQRVVQQITSLEVAKGYIIAKRGKGEAQQGIGEAGSDRKNLLYDDFHPFRPRQFEDDPTCIFMPFEGFNNTVDEFFSSIEGQKLESKLHERELNAKKKLEAARVDQARRLGGLQEVQELNIRKAGAIEANVERVQETMDAVNGLIAQGMDWVEIGKLIELEQKRNNPVAASIKLPLKLHENTISLLLDEERFADDEDSAYETDSSVSDSEDEDPKKRLAKDIKDNRLVIDINLGESPWSNARDYYDQRRSAVLKEKKTLQSSSKALKSTEQKIAQDLKKGLKQEKAVLRPVRRQVWFEKFTWFISSDGYLVLGGRDAQQNEILYKKYLRKGDVYVHADLHGAATVIIRNNVSTPDAPIPPSTLSQAGTLAVASSNAWDSKAGMSAWWVNADQVSKSAPTGEFLPTGSFMVRGRKNFLPPAVLLLGFAVLFQISDQSKARHVKHRIYDEGPTVIGSQDTRTFDEDPTQGSMTSLEYDNTSNGENEDTDDSEDDEDDESKSAADRTNPLQSSHGDEDAILPFDQEMSQVRMAEDEALDVERLGIEESSPIEDVVKGSDDQESSDDGAEAENSENGEDDQDPASTTSSSTKEQANIPSTGKQLQKGPAPRTRGKKSKAKKKAAKYKDQDEEDRLLAQQLYGAAAGCSKAEAEAKAKAEHQAEIEFQKERRKAQHLRAQKKTAEHEEIRKAMLAAGEDTALEDDEAEKMTALDAFVGMPLPGDEIIEAIPVCAPWAALGKYKYKAKLQPGSQKKGKAVKEILTRWISVADSSASGKGSKFIDEESRDTERMWPREVELLRGWKAEECINVVPVGKVRVMMAGGSAAQANSAQKGKGRGGKGGKKGGR
ncbi:MAG: hypothetical protein M1818_007403 [Claussenomyces sp. TS43310]|nr:MAG: hypothetical protein M1818_007403 [Claussenomyces sp. TS43310]